MMLLKWVKCWKQRTGRNVKRLKRVQRACAVMLVAYESSIMLAEEVGSSRHVASCLLFQNADNSALARCDASE